MAKKIETPDWFPADVYSKRLTTREWLFEVAKRVKFNNDDILPHSLRILEKNEVLKHFKTFIFSKDIDFFLAYLKPTIQQPVKHLTVSDVFRMFNLITNSAWYQNHPKKLVFEGAIQAIENDQKLSIEQSKAFETFYETPWHAFNEKSQDESWFPNKDVTHLSGIPCSIDPSYTKEDAAKHFKKLLTKWVGKTQDIESKFELWYESRILAVFDLRLWFTLNNIKYKKIDLHQMLWPKNRISSKTQTLVNPHDDIDHIIALTDQVISKQTLRQLAILTEARMHKKPAK